MAGMKAFCVVLYLCPHYFAMGWRQQGSRKVCNHAIKRQRPRSDERFTRKCHQMGGLVHDVMYFVRMNKKLVYRARPDLSPGSWGRGECWARERV